MIPLPWKAALLICFRYKEIQKKFQVSKFETCSYLRYKGIYATRKVSGRSRNGPLELNWNQRLGHKKAKTNICYHMLTSSTQLQNRSFHVVERTRTSSKCQKIKYARAKRLKILFFIVKYANLWGFCCRRRRARGCLSTLLREETSTKHWGRRVVFQFNLVEIWRPVEKRSSDCDYHLSAGKNSSFYLNYEYSVLVGQS